MKNKTSILVGTRHFFYALLVAVIFYGCNPEGSENDVNIEKSYEVKVLDSCEYIYVSRRPWGGEFSLTHKGNCKFCAERGKKCLPTAPK